MRFLWVALLCAFPLSAGATPELSAGTPVRLIDPARHGGILQGRLVRVEDQALVFQHENGYKESFALATIDSLWIGIERPTGSFGRRLSGKVARFGLLGFGAGAVVGLATGELCTWDGCIPRAGVAFVTGVALGALGTVVGVAAAMRPDLDWRKVEPDRIPALWQSSSDAPAPQRAPPFGCSATACEGVG